MRIYCMTSPHLPHPTPHTPTTPHPPELNTVVEEMDVWFQREAKLASRRVANSQSRLPSFSDRPACMGGGIRLTAFAADDGSSASACAAVTSLLKYEARAPPRRSAVTRALFCSVRFIHTSTYTLPIRHSTLVTFPSDFRCCVMF